jgi:hypothetical protein
MMPMLYTCKKILNQAFWQTAMCVTKKMLITKCCIKKYKCRQPDNSKYFATWGIDINFIAKMYSMNRYLSIPSTIVMSIIVLGVLTSTPHSMAQSNTTSAAANPMSNQTNSNATTSSTDASGSNPTKFHVDEALKALQSGDHQGGVMHMQEAAKTATGTAKVHVDASLNALQSGDHQGGVMHAQEAQKNL